jgi:hypothetical protein
MDRIWGLCYSNHLFYEPCVASNDDPQIPRKWRTRGSGFQFNGKQSKQAGKRSCERIGKFRGAFEKCDFYIPFTNHEGIQCWSRYTVT